MKLTTTGKSHKHDWFGLDFTTDVPTSWTVTFETLGWEVWKVTITFPSGTTVSNVLKKTGERPEALVEKPSLFHKGRWRITTYDVSIEDFEEK